MIHDTVYKPFGVLSRVQQMAPTHGVVRFISTVYTRLLSFPAEQLLVVGRGENRNFTHKGAADSGIPLVAVLRAHQSSWCFGRVQRSGTPLRDGHPKL